MKCCHGLLHRFRELSAHRKPISAHIIVFRLTPDYHKAFDSVTPVLPQPPDCDGDSMHRGHGWGSSPFTPALWPHHPPTGCFYLTPKLRKLFMMAATVTHMTGPTPTLSLLYLGSMV